MKPTCWINSPRPPVGTTVRLFCFAYAGGGASVFRGWPEGLPDKVHVCCVQLPGRENRISEPLYIRLSDLVDDLAVAIRPYLDRPFAFFGHSLGALLSFSLARELRRESDIVPTRLMVSGRRAPQLPDRKPPIYNLPDEEFIEEICRLNGMQTDLLRNAEFMKLILPILRADCTICDTYVYTQGEPLECPISAFHGMSDEELSHEDVMPWRLQTRGSFRMEIFPGDHFYLHTHRQALLKSISRDLLETA